MAVAVGSPAPDAVFCDVGGRDVHLSDFWQDRPTVFLFLRHFGCPFSRKQLDDMRRHYDALRARGVEVVAIGQGTTDEVVAFCGDGGVPFPCVGDPAKRSYASYGLPRGSVWQVFAGPIVTGAQVLWAGYRLDVRGTFMPHSDWFQLPGVAIVDRDGIVRYLHRGRHPGDLPPADDVLAAVVAITTDA